jgi:hypothetical protein
MESTFEIYKGLTGVVASRIIKVKERKEGAAPLPNDSDLVCDVFQDGEEIYFELVS